MIYDAEGTDFNATLPPVRSPTFSDVYSYNPSVNAATPPPLRPPILSGAQGTVFITNPGGRDTVIPLHRAVR